MKIIYVTRSGSRYSVGENNALFKNGEPVLDPEGSPIRYVAVKYNEDFNRDICYETYPVIARTYLIKFEEIKEVLGNKPHIIGISENKLQRYARQGRVRGHTVRTYEDLLGHYRAEAGITRLPFSLLTAIVEGFTEE